MATTLIKNANIVNRGKSFIANVLIEDKIIKSVFVDSENKVTADNIIEAKGKTLIPGVIDDQVHFREPGLTSKGDIFSESRAAAAGGVTSYMDMPNTNPPATSHLLLAEKFNIAAKKSLVNYSFYLGASNDNIDEISKTNPAKIPGVKVFLGSSTGNMLVDNSKTIENIFKNSPVLCAIHSEDDKIINENLKKYINKYGEDIPFHFHPAIRSREACFKSTSRAIEIATKTGCRLHILHISTADELQFLSDQSLKDKKITAEVGVHHLWFNSDNYQKKGAKIKWNPAIKDENDRLKLIEALKLGKIDIVATDHAPHTIEEKSKNYLNAPSGAPMVQHSLQTMLELAKAGNFTIEDVVKYMCHNPADLFKIHKRGYVEEGYYADLVLLDLDKSITVKNENIFYKCGWSPLEGSTLSSVIETTFVNGKIVYDSGQIIESNPAMALEFEY